MRACTRDRWIDLLVILFALLWLSGCRGDTQPPSCCTGDEHPAAAALPDTSVWLLDAPWQDQTGAARRLLDFQGQPVLMAMIFTHCRYACPVIVGDVKKLLARLPAGAPPLPVVLVSMDSARDTPAVLAAFARAHGLDAPRVTLLHGDADAVRELAAVLGVRYAQVEGGDFSHSNQLALLDASGRIACRLEGLGADPAPLLAALARLAPAR